MRGCRLGLSVQRRAGPPGCAADPQRPFGAKGRHPTGSAVANLTCRKAKLLRTWCTAGSVKMASCRKRLHGVQDAQLEPVQRHAHAEMAAGSDAGIPASKPEPARSGKSFPPARAAMRHPGRHHDGTDRPKLRVGSPLLVRCAGPARARVSHRDAGAGPHGAGAGGAETGRAASTRSNSLAAIAGRRSAPWTRRCGARIAGTPQSCGMG